MVKVRGVSKDDVTMLLRGKRISKLFCLSGRRTRKPRSKIYFS